MGQGHVDMDPWIREKLRSVLRALAQIVDEFQKLQQEPAEEEVLLRRSIVVGEVYVAIFNGTKLLAHFSDVSWEPSDADLLFYEGSIGYRKILWKYKLSGD